MDKIIEAIKALMGTCENVESNLDYAEQSANDCVSQIEESRGEIEDIRSDLGSILNQIEEGSEPVDLDAIKKEVTNDILDTIKVKLWDSIDSMFRSESDESR
jgi:hypothetical protein